MSWLRVKMRSWLGVAALEEVLHSQVVRLLVQDGALIENVQRLTDLKSDAGLEVEALKTRLAALENAQDASQKPVKVAKPYRTASEVRNKLERESESEKKA